jgi:hypothetical protein
VELKAKPATGRPSRLTSVITATTDVVISEKSKPELRSSDLIGIAVSRMSTMRMVPRSRLSSSATRLRQGFYGQGPSPPEL